MNKRGRKKTSAKVKKGNSETKEQLKVRAEMENRLLGSDDKVYQVPEYLDDLSKAYYKYIITELKDLELLGNLDIAVVEQTAICLSQMRQLDDQVKRENIIITQIDRYGNEVRKENPAWTAKQKLLKEFRAFANLLPMSPSARAQLAGIKIEAKEEQEDPLLQILQRKRKQGENTGT